MGTYGSGMRPDQEEWKLQVGWYAQHEAEEEASDPSEEGRQPLHQRALRLQGQASLQNCEGVRNEEAQGVIELSLVFESYCRHEEFWWAVSSNSWELYRSVSAATP